MGGSPSPCDGEQRKDATGDSNNQGEEEEMKKERKKKTKGGGYFVTLESLNATFHISGKGTSIDLPSESVIGMILKASRAHKIMTRK
mmetsp:Transcript_5973/g.8212  ORF Transcript_5973/g.8212 Transcript_5973/m.8212 type:complete len:87 (+) Transcript_5973:875-1135(+)